MPKCYPISLNVENRICLVVGGGKVAERKVMTLIEYGARVRLLAPAITDTLSVLSSSGRIVHINDSYKSDYLEGSFLVIGATDDDSVNARVSSDCMERGLLVNVVDDPPRGNFYVPAVVRRGALQIAISTDGKSPLLARKIKERLEEDFASDYSNIVDIIGDLREKIIIESSDDSEKKRRLSELIDSITMNYLRQGKFNLAKERILNAYSGSGSKS